VSTLREPVLDAGQRLRRLLVILAHLAAVGEAPLGELAERFAMSESALVAELELAACCGLPPYTPDQLLELVVDDDRVYAFGLDALRRPPRLTPEEGFAVAAAARALLAVPGADGDGPLAHALAKLEAALGEDHVRIEIEDAPFVGLLRQAAANGECVELLYRGANRDEPSRRVVEPHSVIAREGHFYLDAYCRLAEGWRRFQVARIVEARPTGERVPPREAPPEFAGYSAFAGGEGAREVTLAIEEAALGLLGRLRAERAPTGPDGRALVTLQVANERWLARLLLSFGGRAELLEPASWRSLAAEEAARALAKYREP
jgi:proteasome accessory factor C